MAVYSDKDLMQVDPTAKVEALMSEFASFNPVLMRKCDNGYDWLEDDECACIIIKSHTDQEIEIVLAGEFTLYFGCSHYHYWAYESGYEWLVSDVHSIIKGELCSFSLSYDGWNWCAGFWDGDMMDKSKCAQFLQDNSAKYIYAMKKGYGKKLKPNSELSVRLNSFTAPTEEIYSWKLSELIDVKLSQKQH